MYYNIRQSEIECYTDKFCPTFLGLRTASHFGNISLKAYIYIYRNGNGGKQAQDWEKTVW